MTQEEAIEVVKKNWPDSSYTCLREALVTLVPELKESEDGKIIDTLIWLVEGRKKNRTTAYGDVKIDDILAWLEKQKGRNPVVEVLTKAGLKPYKDGNKWCVLAGDNIQEGICGFGDTVDEALYQFLMEVLVNQKPSFRQIHDGAIWHNGLRTGIEPEKRQGRNPADLSEMMVHKEPYIAPVPAPMVADEQKPVDYEAELKKCEDNPLYFYDKYVSIKQKPWEWREEERKILDSIIDDYEAASKSFCGYDGKIGLLRAIRDGEYNLPKRKWSEEDERNIRNLESILYYDKKLPEETRAELGDFLKSLRPQSHWRPTKTMLDALNWARSEFHPECPNTMDNLTYLCKELEQMYYDGIEYMNNVCPTTSNGRDPNREDVADAFEDGIAEGIKRRWKPSEAQMSMLLAVINEPRNAGAESCHLALSDLYQDLRKL